MTAPQIPNLLDSLRGSNPPRNARPQRRQDGASSRSGDNADKTVQGTDSDAAGSRLSAVTLGYLDDEFAEAFLPAGLDRNARRMPIINRGTYVRTTAIDRLVWAFVDGFPAHQRLQIVSLGAGTDTRFFRMMRKRPELAERLVYRELDFAATTAAKVKAIERTPGILGLLKSAAARAVGVTEGEDATVRIAEDRSSLWSAVYSLQPLDLRRLAGPSASGSEAGAGSVDLEISAELPTLFISECCLTYLQPETGMGILSYLAAKAVPPPVPLEIVQYEPLHPTDAFGRTMISNLAARGISVPGVEGVPSLNAHKERLKKAGFIDTQEAWEIKEIWDHWVDEGEKDRLRRLEMVDEEEEWILLAGHYGIVRAKRIGDDMPTPVK